MQVFHHCKGLLTRPGSGKAIRKIWNNLKVNTFKWWIYISAEFPMWGDKPPKKHETATVIASLGLQSVCLA